MGVELPRAVIGRGAARAAEVSQGRFLKKPFRLDEVAAMVRDTLDEARRA